MSNHDTSLAFWDWVEILGSHNFNSDKEGRQVRLSFPDGHNKDEFIKVLRSWNLGVSASHVETVLALDVSWDRHSGVMDSSWQLSSLPPSGKSEFPPCLPYLVAFSIAWNEEVDGLRPGGYYKRLGKLLPPRSGDNAIQTKDFEKITRAKIWQRVSTWANQINEGRLGYFTVTSLGKHIHIGFPLSQVLLSPRTREKLDQIFLREKLSSKHCLEDYEIKNLLVTYADHFDQRIRVACENNTESTLVALYEEIRLSLLSFSPSDQLHGDGGSSGSGGAESVPSVNLQLECFMGLHGILRWSFALDDSSYLGEIPQLVSSKYTLNPGQEGCVVSQASGDEHLNDPLQFSGFDPLGQELRFENPLHVVKWRKRDIRIFSEGAGVWVEQDWIPKSKHPLLVLSKSNNEDLLACHPDAKIPGSIWPDCHLHSFSTEESKENLRKKFPHRKPYHSQSIHLVGGMRYEPGKDIFFAHGLPRVELDDGWEPRCDHPHIDLAPRNEQFIVTPTKPISSRTDFEILASKTGKKLKQKPLTVDPSPAPLKEVQLSNSGEIVSGDIPCWEDRVGEAKIDWDSSAMRLWEVMSSWATCSWAPKFKDAVKHLFDDSVKPWWVADAWAKIGLIDICETPNDGQWRSLGITPGRLQKLPWDLSLSGKQYSQAILLGQIHWAEVKSIINKLPGGVSLDICSPDSRFLPPRYRFYSEDKSALSELADTFNVYWVEEYRIDEAIGIAGYEQNVLQTDGWIPGALDSSPNLEVFSPFLLTDRKCDEKSIERLKEISGQYVLETYTDPNGQMPPRYCLFDCYKSLRKTLKQNDRQAARWVAYNANSRRFASSFSPDSSEFGIPYDSDSGTLMIPKELNPPIEVFRILTSCSGKLPQSADRNLNSEMCTLNSRFQSEFKSQFLYTSGSQLCLYQRVPHYIAVSVCELLQSSLVDLHAGDDRSEHN